MPTVYARTTQQIDKINIYAYKQDAMSSEIESNAFECAERDDDSGCAKNTRTRLSADFRNRIICLVFLNWYRPIHRVLMQKSLEKSNSSIGEGNELMQ